MNEEEYACGNIKGTVYGPAKFLPKDEKRFRRMNFKEYNHYMDKVEDTDGFDVDGCSGFICGGIAPLPSSCSDWKFAEHAAMFAALEVAQVGGKSIEFIRLEKANTQPVSGILYYLTFYAIDTTDRKEKQYKAKVWATAGRGEMELVYFEDVSSKWRQDFTKKKPKKKVMKANLGTVSRFLFDHEENDQENEKHLYTTTTIGPRPGQVRRDAYCLLVKELKEKNPKWTYAQARRDASRKWKIFTYPDKSRFLNEARNIFLRKHHPNFSSIL